MFRSQLRLSQNSNQFPEDTAIMSTDNLNMCDTIHVALVCMDKCTRYVVPMLKSLLYHRQNPIHFHIMVDNNSEGLTKKLFETWDLPDVKVTCYNTANKMSLIEWIPNTHYSGIYTLVKLILPDILPKTLLRVIILDADLTFFSDISYLWRMFTDMNPQQFIGVVENESDWYLKKKQNRWPALGRGFNTGVVLLDLEKMRHKIDWYQTWHDAFQNNILEQKYTMLADQDIVNAIIKENPEIVYNISCEYNVQLSSQTLSKDCYGNNFDRVKVLHWNSPNKYKINLEDAPFFRSVHQTFVDLNGNLLRKKLYICNPSEDNTPKVNKSDICHTFRIAQTTKLRTHLYFMDYSYVSKDNFDITLVVQLSMDRLQFLERLVKYWEGPLSAAIYLSDWEVTDFKKFIEDWSETLRERKNIGYHLVYKQEDMHYPVNYLRNVALENVNTPYVFLMDVDFVPMAGLYDHLRRAVQLVNPALNKKALVVAAFETQRYRVRAPRSKAALRASLREHDAAPFRAREWPSGHRATNYTRWLQADAPYEVEWQPDYEPYLVVHRSVPKYDTRFSGFGWNKVSHSVELRALGYRAVVLPGAFAVHAPHAPSPDITLFRTSNHYRICLAQLKQEFMNDLRRKYNVTLDDLTAAKEGHHDSNKVANSYQL